jgi:hypothetical protein
MEGRIKRPSIKKKGIESITREGGFKMRKMKSLMPIILLSILLVTGMASAATLTPVGTCNGQDKVDVTLSVSDVTGIIGYDITVTGTGLTTTTADVSKTGSIAASWTVFQAQAVTGGVRILAAGCTACGSTGAGNLGTITFTATDGTVNTETVSVTVKEVSGGTLTPAAMTPVDCSPTGCLEWTDVITKYNAYVAGTAEWADVIACYNEYVAAP